MGISLDREATSASTSPLETPEKEAATMEEDSTGQKTTKAPDDQDALPHVESKWEPMGALEDDEDDPAWVPRPSIRNSRACERIAKLRNWFERLAVDGDGQV